jgi:hypothetical protein
VTRAHSRRGTGSAGVSLLGLLIVVVMMGVLAVIALSAVGSGDSTQRSVVAGQHPAGSGNPDVAAAQRVACTLSAKAIESAALAYYAGHAGVWPPDIASLTDGATPLLRSGPDPKWGLVYDNTNGTVDASGCAKL